tara:strand:- start:947 stop:1663 length:717 start_codon:yes stop_codon:yes gene_type:complete
MTIPIKIISKQEYLKQNKKPDQEKVWDKISKSWKEYRIKKLPIVEEFLNKINSRQALPKKIKIIDLGCGAGRNMIPYPNIEYTGVDFSENQLKQADKYIKANKIKANLIKSKANNLKDIKDNTFDHGLFIATLHSIEAKEERKKALEEFHRVLKPNSTALLSVWNANDQRFSHIKNTRDIYMSWTTNHIPYMRSYYLYDKQELIELLESVGFKVLQLYEAQTHDRFSKKNWIFRIKKQ